MIWTTVIGNPGVSGAPLLDLNGSVIGIATGPVQLPGLSPARTRSVRIVQAKVNWLSANGML